MTHDNYWNSHGYRGAKPFAPAAFVGILGTFAKELPIDTRTFANSGTSLYRVRAARPPSARPGAHGAR